MVEVGSEEPALRDPRWDEEGFREWSSRHAPFIRVRNLRQEHDGTTAVDNGMPAGGFVHDLTDE